jgi:hypothetical protein
MKDDSRHGVDQTPGRATPEEIRFTTPFDYMFPRLARDPQSRLPETNDGSVREALLKLGEVMADPGRQGSEQSRFNARIPAVMTYLGQFIDHDITARTDRDPGEFGDFPVPPLREGEDPEAILEQLHIAAEDGCLRDPLEPVSPDKVVRFVTNGRRPRLDLDSVYGDGPALSDDGTRKESDKLYDANRRLKLEQASGYIDVPRSDAKDVEKQGRTALIADMRNDENLLVSQLHAAFLAFHNAVASELEGDDAACYSEARQRVRWAYQYIVANDYLSHVCDPAVVNDIQHNGVRFYRPAALGGVRFMPLEFSVAGFRFAHSMIRPFYRLNRESTRSITDLLGTAREDSPVLEDDRVAAASVVQWENLADFGCRARRNPQPARRIDTKLAEGLLDLPMVEAKNSFLAQLAQRNLARGYLLSLPTGEAVAQAMGVQPLTTDELYSDPDPKVHKVLQEVLRAFGYADKAQCIGRTPLWYYVLKEAELRRQGNALGTVGSRLVAETLLGSLECDPDSYLNSDHPAIHRDGIDVPRCRAHHATRPSRIRCLADLLEYAGVPVSD